MNENKQTIKTVIAATITGITLLCTAYTGYWFVTNGPTVQAEYTALKHTVFNDNGVLTPVIKKMPEIPMLEYFEINKANREYFDTAVKDILTFEAKYGSRGEVDPEDMVKYSRAAEIIKTYKGIPERTSDDVVKEKYEGYIKKYEQYLKEKPGLSRAEEVSEFSKWTAAHQLLGVAMIGTVILILRSLMKLCDLIVRSMEATGGKDEESE